MSVYDLAVVGGGAAGFFGAIACAEARPGARVVILERSREPLAKVRISGGGRCNVTNACDEPSVLVTRYPRGGSALRGPFSRFQTRDTAAWFSARGVTLKTEPDGRMFPVTDDSMTVVRALKDAAAKAGVVLKTEALVAGIESGDEYRILFEGGGSLSARRLLLATGGDRRGHDWAKALGHRIVPPVPSLFTFRVVDPRISGLAGLSVLEASVRLEGSKSAQTGPLLVTHWGLSGPAVLKTSAWEARTLFDAGYKAILRVNWLPALPPAALEEVLKAIKRDKARRRVRAENPAALPQRLWERLAVAAGVEEDRRWADLSGAQMKRLLEEVSDGKYAVSGKGAFKEEFVTCGGVRLDEVDFRTMESRVRPGLYFAGEVLDVDGLTGGFNFQNAWTTGWIAGRAAAA